MSIQDYRKALADVVPGAERLVMNYGDIENGNVEIFAIDDLVVRIPPTSTPEKVKQAFLEALKQ